MTIIDPLKAKQATEEDKELLNAVHPTASKLIHWLAKKPARKIPKLGVVVSDAELIRTIFLDRKHFSKMGDGASSALWNPIIGDTGLVNMDGDLHLKLRRELAPAFSQKIIPALVNKTYQQYSEQLLLPLKEGKAVDMVQIASNLAYRTLWDLIGLPDDKSEDYDFEETTKVLRSVTEGIKIHRKTLTKEQQNSAKLKLAFVEKLTIASYNQAEVSNENTTTIAVMKQAGYSLEETVSVVKALMVTGTETIISFIPRMTALFVTSGYLDYLVQNPDHLSKGIDEAFRVTVPTPVAVRSCIEPTAIGNIKVAKGDRVILSTVEACHRYGDFNPETVLDKNVKGLWFGAGVHMCIGIPVAKAEAEKIIEELIQIHRLTPIRIVQKTKSTRGHTGSYESLIIQC